VQYIKLQSLSANNRYIIQEKTRQHSIEFINDNWYILSFQNRKYYMKPENKIVQHNNTLGLGYWGKNNLQNPKNKEKERQVQQDPVQMPITALTSSVQQEPAPTPIQTTTSSLQFSSRVPIEEDSENIEQLY
jgi:hypothetical protein